jgi:hypothetical protein
MKSTEGRRRSERGSVAVESTLVLLAWVAVMIFMLDCGQLLLLHQSLVERVRNAVRYGAVVEYDVEKLQNLVMYGSTGDTGGRPSFNLDRSMVSVNRLGAGTDGDRVYISVAGYPVRFMSPWVARLAEGLPISATAPYEVAR